MQGDAVMDDMSSDEAGYTRDDLAKIWGGNVLRLLRAAEAAKAA